jgi:DNA-binding NarL/FixJ family response regulator
MDEQTIPTPIRVLLVDDHALFREGLVRLFVSEPEIEVAGQCASAAEALELLVGAPVDLVLLDYQLADHAADQFIRAARRNGYEGKILMLTGKMTAEESLKTLQLGASGIFLKHNPPATLIDAIRLVLSGHVWLDKKVIQILAEAVPPPETEGLAHALSEREKHVLRGILEGFTNRKIGQEIGVSEGTVKATLQQLFHKTGVRTRSQLVRVALEAPRRLERR